MEEETSTELNLLDNSLETSEPVVEPEPVVESDSAWEEPSWEEPSFENVTISSVVWAGTKHWDRAIYTLSNGNTAFSSKGLDAGDYPFNYEEIRTSGGGYFSDPGGVVGHTHTRNGGALIIQQGESFLQQQYAWGNQGPVMSSTTFDVTKQIGSIEEREDEDMNGDGFIGAPEEDEIEVEVSSVVYDNPNANFDRSIYKMTDGSVRLAEQGLSIGDLPYEGYDQLNEKNGSPIETDGIVGAIWINSGFGVIYNNGGVVTQQAFKWGNRGPRVSGKLRDVTKQIDTIEDREGIDINGDGQVGSQFEDSEVQSIVYDNPDSGFDRSIYKMSDGTVRLAEQGLSVGDLPFEGDDLSDKDGSPIETVGLVGVLGLRNGLGIIYNNDGVVMQQQYKWGGRGIKAIGKLRDVTKQFAIIEEREGIDVNGDGQIGEQFDEDAEVQSVLFSPNPDSYYDRSLYELTTGVVVIAEIGLQPGEIPFESDPLSNADGGSFAADDLVGLIGTKRGEAVIFKRGDSYLMQEYKWAGRGLKPKGKERDITRRIYEVEDRENSDFTGDSIIGEPSSLEYSEVSRVIFSGNDEFDQGLYQMKNGDLVFAEPDLEPGDTPFEDDIVTGNNGQSYQGEYVVGIYPIKNGFALVEEFEGIYKEQGFRFKGSGKAKPFGKSRTVKDIGAIESRSGFDINNDGLIADDSNMNDLAPALRLIQPLDLNNFSDLLA